MSRDGSSPERGHAAEILLVDDEPELVDLLAEALVEYGYRVAVARDGLSALHYLRVNSLPRVMVLDLIMPGMTGLEVMDQMRSIEGARLVRIIMATGRPDIDPRDLAARGVSCVVPKPIPMQLLLAALDKTK